MRAISLAVLALASALTSAHAAAKPTRFWNLTSSTITVLQLAPAGTEQFGPNQCSNDKDGSVDHDERLNITSVESGHYDAKIGYANGRLCRVKNLTIEAGKVFSIEDKDLTACNR
jgi:hypothetical protein